MKTQADVLSFEDITTYDNHLIDLVELCENEGSPTGSQIANFINEERPQLVERFIHTFLEWDSYNQRIYNLGWSLTYTACQGDHPPISTATIVETLQEAEIIAVKKIGRLLGEQIHLESMEKSTFLSHPSPYDGFYKVTNGAGDYRGMVEIAQMEQLK